MHVNLEPQFVDKIVNEVKSQGVFDQFRKDSMSDVDTKPAYQNLRQRVENSVSKFLADQKWTPETNKNQLREKLRSNLMGAGFLDVGVQRIVDQVVNPKISTVFQPKIEDIVYKYLGIEKPIPKIEEEILPIVINGSLAIKTDEADLLPNDLEAVSPDSNKSERRSVKSEPKEDLSSENIMLNNSDDDDESPPFEPLVDTSPVKIKDDENSNNSHMSGLSGLASQDSNKNKIDTTNGTINITGEITQESQLSQVSSNSHLSIVTNEDEPDEDNKVTIKEERNVDISEEAQMPKFSENSNSCPAVNTETLHFDIKKDEIKFEGTERNTEPALIEQSDSTSKIEPTETTKQEVDTQLSHSVDEISNATLNTDNSSFFDDDSEKALQIVEEPNELSQLSQLSQCASSKPVPENSPSQDVCTKSNSEPQSDLAKSISPKRADTTPPVILPDSEIGENKEEEREPDELKTGENNSMTDENDDAKSSEALEDAKSSEAIDDAKSSEAIDDAKSSEALDDAKSSEAIDDAKSSEAISDSKSSEAINDSKSSEAINDSKSSEAIDDSKSSEAIDDAKSNESVDIVPPPPHSNGEHKSVSVKSHSRDKEFSRNSSSSSSHNYKKHSKNKKSDKDKDKSRKTSSSNDSRKHSSSDSTNKHSSSRHSSQSSSRSLSSISSTKDTRDHKTGGSSNSSHKSKYSSRDDKSSRSERDRKRDKNERDEKLKAEKEKAEKAKDDHSSARNKSYRRKSNDSNDGDKSKDGHHKSSKNAVDKTFISSSAGDISNSGSNEKDTGTPVSSDINKTDNHGETEKHETLSKPIIVDDLNNIELFIGAKIEENCSLSKEPEPEQQNNTFISPDEHTFEDHKSFLARKLNRRGNNKSLTVTERESSPPKNTQVKVDNDTDAEESDLEYFNITTGDQTKFNNLMDRYASIMTKIDPSFDLDVELQSPKLKPNGIISNVSLTRDSPSSDNTGSPKSVKKRKSNTVPTVQNKRKRRNDQKKSEKTHTITTGENQTSGNLSNDSLSIDCYDYSSSNLSKPSTDEDINNILIERKISPTPSDSSTGSKENDFIDKNANKTESTGKILKEEHKELVVEKKPASTSVKTTQRYSSDDLYKPRPILSQRSKRRCLDGDVE